MILQDTASRKTWFQYRVLSSYRMDSCHPQTMMDIPANKKSQQDTVRKRNWCHSPQLKNFQENKFRCRTMSCNLEDKITQQGKESKTAVCLFLPTNNCQMSKHPSPGGLRIQRDRMNQRDIQYISKIQ